MTGSTGSIPNLAYMDIHYSQSAMFTPSDFAFPHDSVKAEATPNTETTLIADLDLGLLKELNRHGAVRNLEQRRTDLYEVSWLGAEIELRGGGNLTGKDAGGSRERSTPRDDGEQTPQEPLTQD